MTPLPPQLTVLLFSGRLSCPTLSPLSSSSLQGARRTAHHLAGSFLSWRQSRPVNLCLGVVSSSPLQAAFAHARHVLVLLSVVTTTNDEVCLQPKKVSHFECAFPACLPSPSSSPPLDPPLFCSVPRRRARTTMARANPSCTPSTPPSRRTAGQGPTTTSASRASRGSPWAAAAVASPSRSTTSLTPGRATRATRSAAPACPRTSSSGSFILVPFVFRSCCVFLFVFLAGRLG